LRQIRQIKDVATAQRDAINSLKIRLSQLDVMQECTKAERALSDIRTCLLTTKTEIPLGAFDNLAMPLVSILEGVSFLTEDVKLRLKVAIDAINRESENPTRLKSDQISSAKQVATIRDYHGLLIKIRAQIQQEQGS
jgi:hypothetical protein